MRRQGEAPSSRNLALKERKVSWVSLCACEKASGADTHKWKNEHMPLSPCWGSGWRRTTKYQRLFFFSPTFSSCLIPQWEGNNQEPITDKEIAPIIQPQFHKTIRGVNPVERQLIHKSHICVSRQEKLTCTIMCSVSLSHKKAYISDVT